MDIRLSLSALPGRYSPVIMAHIASTMYLKLMGRLSKVSSSSGAKRVSKMLQGSRILSRCGLRAKDTMRCWAL